MGGPDEDHAFPPERVKAAQELYKKSGGMPGRLREEMMLDALKGEDAEVHDEAVKLDTLPELAANGIVPTEPVPVSNPYQPLERAAESAEPETSAN